jgi:hypothetical protein
MKFIFSLFAIAGMFLLNTVTLATAQSDAVRQIYAFGASVPTNIDGVHTYPAPLAGFNPLTATDEELAIHGFPARPDQETDANHYKMWARVMAAAKNRWTGELKPVPSWGKKSLGGKGIEMGKPSPSLQSGPQSVKPASGPVQLASTTFSGLASTNNLRKWTPKTSFSDVWAEFTLPTIQPPFETNDCGNFQPWTEYRIGIDGGASLNGLGGGYVDSSCGIAGFFLVSWGPNGLSTFGANHGDLLYVEAANSLGGFNNGYVFVEDLSTLTYGSWNIAAPNQPLIGNSVEWLVGNPNGAESLGNTTGIAFEGAEALNLAGKQFFPGSTTPSTAVFTMVDSLGQDVEIVSYGSGGKQGQSSLFFQTTGCAYSGGCQ